MVPKHHHRRLKPSAKDSFSPGSAPEDLCPAHRTSHRAPLHRHEEQLPCSNHRQLPPRKKGHQPSHLTETTCGQMPA
jgi:hypothetical protein